MAIKAYSYAKDGSKALSKNFHVREFKCKDGSDPIFIDDELVALLQKIRDHFGKAVNINSAFRTASHNAKQKNASKYSQHLYGKAADIWIAGVSVDALASKHCFPEREALDDTTRTVLSTSMCGR